MNRRQLVTRLFAGLVALSQIPKEAHCEALVVGQWYHVWHCNRCDAYNWQINAPKPGDKCSLCDGKFSEYGEYLGYYQYTGH